MMWQGTSRAAVDSEQLIIAYEQQQKTTTDSSQMAFPGTLTVALLTTLNINVRTVFI